MTLDIPFVRSQFPAFQEPSLEGWAFFENAGGSYPCRQVIKKLTDFYLKNKVQPYYPYPASAKAGQQMDISYERMAEYLNADPSEIHFGPSTTQNVYVLANAMRPMWEDGDEIIVSCQDHEANSGAWRRLAKRGIKVLEWHVDKETGLLDTADLEELLSVRTKMVAYPHCSNLIGQINPVKLINKIIRQHGALSVVDGVAFAPHSLPDLSDLKADIYLFSLYKTFGPHLGLMYVNKDLMGRLENQSHFFKDGVYRNMFTPAGPDHAQIAAVSGITDYMDTLFAHHFKEDAKPGERIKALNSLFRRHELELMAPLMEYLVSREDVRLLGSGRIEDRAPTICFLPKKKSVDAVYRVLTDHNLMLGKGNYYAYRPLMDMDIPVEPGVLRISFLHYTSMAEIDQLIRGLEAAL